MDTETLIIILIALAVLIAAALGALIAVRSRRSQKLRQKYGPEYDYTMEKVGDRRAAEESLAEREQRVSQLAIRQLDHSEWIRFHTKWMDVQADFVDEPAESVQDANTLIKEVMAARGFPMADFEQRAEDISVLYPDVVSNYRKAHAIALMSLRNGVTTEELRQAMVHYRSLFEELLESEAAKAKEKTVS